MEFVNAIGSIRLQSVIAERVRELALERSVADVDQDEALNGAAVSDVVRIARREQNHDSPSVPFHIYLQRAAKFQGQLRSKKAEKPAETECPIEKARAQSTTGANAPLNWLTPDHVFGGDQQPPAVGGDSLVTEEAPLHSVELEEGLVSYTAPLVNSEPTSLMAEEWLFSPHSN